MNLETKITIYKFTPQLFTLTPFLRKKHHKRFVPPRNDGLRCIGRDKKHPCPDVDFHSERMEVHIHTYKNEYNICITLYIHRIHH